MAAFNPEATSHPISPQLHAQCNLYATYLCSPMIMSYDCRPTYQNFAPYRTKRLLYKCSSVAKTCPKAHLSSLQTNQSHARAVSFLDKTNVIQLLFSSCGSLSLLLSGCHGCLLSQLSHQVPVSVHVVDSGNSGPELGCLHPRCRESSLLSGVWEIPLLRQNDLSSVGEHSSAGCSSCKGQRTTYSEITFRIAQKLCTVKAWALSLYVYVITL